MSKPPSLHSKLKLIALVGILIVTMLSAIAAQNVQKTSLGSDITLEYNLTGNETVILFAQNRSYNYLTIPGGKLAYHPQTQGLFGFTVMNTATGDELYSIIYNVTNISEQQTDYAKISSDKQEYALGEKATLAVDSNLANYKIMVSSPSRTYEFIGSGRNLTFVPKEEGIHNAALYDEDGIELARTQFVARTTWSMQPGKDREAEPPQGIASNLTEINGTMNASNASSPIGAVLNVSTDKSTYIVLETVGIKLSLPSSDITISNGANTYSFHGPPTQEMQFVPIVPGKYTVIVQNEGLAANATFAVQPRNYKIEQVRYIRTHEGISAKYNYSVREHFGVQQKVDQMELGKAYDVNLEFESAHVKSISLDALNFSGTLDIGYDELKENDAVLPNNIGGKMIAKLFALDPSSVNFTVARVTSIAHGSELFKCQEYNFSTRTCTGEFFKVMDIVPGKEYSFLMTPEDPLYGEMNSTVSCSCTATASTTTSACNITCPINITRPSGNVVSAYLMALQYNASVTITVQSGGGTVANSGLHNGTFDWNQNRGDGEVHVGNLTRESSFTVIWSNTSIQPTNGLTIGNCSQWSLGKCLWNINLRTQVSSSKPGKTVQTQIVLNWINYTWNYSLNSPPSFTNASVNDSGINVSEYVRHSVLWNDSTYNLSFVVFEWNATGSLCNSGFQNVTNSSIDSTLSMINASMQIPIACEGKTIGWKMHANDSFGEWNATDMQTYAVLNYTPLISMPSQILNATVLKSGEYVLLNATITDNSGTINTTLFAINDTNYTATNQYPYFTYSWQCLPSLNSGYFTWNATFANDTAGYYSANSSVGKTWICDADAPSVSLSSPVHGAHYPANFVPFNFTVADEAYIANCSVIINNTLNVSNQSAITLGQTATINSSMADGFYTWTVNCTDLASNTGTATPRNLTVDATPVQINGSSLAANDTTLSVGERIRLNISITDNFGRINASYFTLNSSLGMQNYSATDAYPIFWVELGCAVDISTGDYAIVAVHANDTAGNLVANTSVYQTFFCDDSLPTVNGTSAALNDTLVRQGELIKLNASIYDNNAINVSIFTINSTNYTASRSGNESYVIWNCTSEGSYKFAAAFANDSAGNYAYNGSLNLTWTCDINAPAISLVLPSNNSNMSKQSVNFTYSVFDMSGLSAACELLINSSLNATDTSIVANNTNRNISTNLSDGLYAWTINCTDNVGYEGTNSSHYLIGIDTTSPVVQLVSPVNNTLNTSTRLIQFTYNISEEFSAIDSCTLIFNGLANNTVSSPISKGISQTIEQLVDNTDYNWSVNCTDALGFTGSSATFNLSVLVINDTTPPTITLVSPQNNSWLNYSSNITFVYLPSDGTGIANCSLIINDTLNITSLNVTNNLNNNFTLNNSPEGNFKWHINCTDNTSNLNRRESVFNIYTADTTMPAEFNLSQPANNTVSTNLTPMFVWNLTADSNFANYTLYIDNNSDFASAEYVLYSTSITNTSLAQTISSNYRWYWRVKAQDRAANSRYSVGTLEYVTDILLPNVTLNSPLNNSYLNISSVNFNYTANDTNLAACELWTNFSGEWTRNTTNSSPVSESASIFAVAGISQGVYKWNVKCNDSAANSDYARHNYSVIVDDVAPFTFSMASNDSDSKVRGASSLNITVFANDSLSGVANVSVNGTYMTQLNSTAWQLLTTPVTLGCSADGNCTLSATATDTAGNKNSSATIVLTVDSTPPSVVAFNVNDTDLIAMKSAALNFTVNVSDGGTAITSVVLNSTSMSQVSSNMWQQLNSTQNFNCPSDGLCHLAITATDEAGNYNDSARLNITIDTTAPLVFNYTINDSDLIVKSEHLLNFSANVTDPNGIFRVLLNNTVMSNISNVYYTLNTSLQFGCSGDINCTLTIFAYDIAGNLNSSATMNLSVDDTAPEVFNLDFPANATESTNASPTLNWTVTQDSHFKNYTIFIDTSTAFSSPIYTFSNVLVANNSLPLAVNLSMNTNWHWKVIAYDILDNSRNSTQYFTYITDNSTPNISLLGPVNDTVITNNSIVIFSYSVNETNTIRNCSIYLNDEIQSTTSSPPEITKNSTLSFEVSQTNGRYNWTIECFDSAGNRKLSSPRYFNLSVPVPIYKWMNAFGGTTTPSAVDINLSLTNDDLENSRTVSISGGSFAAITNATSQLGLGNNGLFIPARSSVLFGATESTTAGANNGFISWQLFYVNGTEEVLLSQYGNISLGGLVMSTASKTNWSANGNATPNYGIYLNSSMNLRLKVWSRYTGGGSRNFQVFWENSSQTFANISAYEIGFMQANLTLPVGDTNFTENSTILATCNVSCKSGYCLNSQVQIQANSTGKWLDINSSSGNLILNGTGQNNPSVLGTVNGSISEINYTLKGNVPSNDNGVRCIAVSDHSTMNGTKVISLNITALNVPPTVSSAAMPSIVDLLAGSLTNVYCNATIYDENGASDIMSANATLFDSSVSNMSDADNFTRHYTNMSCLNTSSGTFTKNFECRFAVYYFANNGSWTCNITANDSQGESIHTNLSTTISELLALNVTEVMDYGALGAGATSVSDIQINLTNIGNQRLDVIVWGYARNSTVGDNLSMVCDSGQIPIANQRYNLTTSGQAFSAMQNLSGLPQGITHTDFNLAKAVSAGGALQSLYWKISVPTGIRGTCNGTVVYSAIAG